MIKNRETSKFRQRQIVEAVRQIIAVMGMETLTIREVAKKVGISEGDIYRHFASKKEIIILLIEDIESTLMETVDRAIAEKQEPLQRLESVFKAHLSYVEQRRGISLIVIAETLRLQDKDLRKRMYQVVNRYMTRIEDLLTQGVQGGQIGQDIDTHTAAFAFFALVHTRVTLWSLSDSSFSLARRHKPLWRSYLASIGAIDSKSRKVGEMRLGLVKGNT